MIGKSLVQIPAPSWAELHVEVSLIKILDPKLLLMCGWHLAWWPLTSVRGHCDELATCAGSTLLSPRHSWDWPQQKPPRPHKRDEAVGVDGWRALYVCCWVSVVKSECFSVPFLKAAGWLSLLLKLLSSSSTVLWRDIVQHRQLFPASCPPSPPPGWQTQSQQQTLHY